VVDVQECEADISKRPNDTNQQELPKRVSHLKIKIQAPPNLEKKSAKEEVINQNIIRSSF